MNRWRRIVRDASRSRRVLWRLAAALLLLGTLAGYGLSKVRPPRPETLSERLAVALIGSMLDSEFTSATPQAVGVVEAMEKELQDRSVAFVHVLDVIPLLGRWIDASEDEALRTLFATRFNAEAAALAIDLLAAIRDEDAGAAERLRAAAESAEPPRYAAHALGLFEWQRQQFRAAYVQFRREGEHADAVESRVRAIEAISAAEDWAELRRLQAEPDYADLISPAMALQSAIHLKDWWAIAKWVPVVQFTGLDAGILALTVVTGIAWAFFLAHLGESPGLWTRHTLLCALAFVAGVVSTTPTIYVVILQDDFLGFAEGGEFVRSLAYFVGGVGVREEFCKLLLFAPFLPVLIKRDDELEVLIVAGFVGLGFAIEENGNYFLASQGSAVAGRFLTANFLHVALTGVNGLALYRACTRGMAGWNEFLTVLGITIVAHGLYDALPGIADAQLGVYLAMAVFVLTSRYFFNRAHELRDNRRMMVSLTGAFVLGISLVAGAMILFQTARLGLKPGLMVSVPEMIGSGILLIMFFREFDEPLLE